MSFDVRYIHSPRDHAAYGDSVGGALSTAAGFAEEDLGPESVERFWTSGLAATTFLIAIDLTDDAWTTLALFDVCATDGTLPDDVFVDMGTAMSGAWAGAPEEITLNGSGDGFLTPAAGPKRYVKLTINFGSAKTLRIGAVFAGTKVQLTRAFAERNDTHDKHLIENVSPGGTRTATRIAAESRTLSLGWAELLDTERAELSALWTNSDDGLEPIVLLPNSADSTQVYHGTLPGAWSEDVDVLYSGISLDFVQSGRGA